MGCQIQEIFSDVEICDLVASVTNAMNKSIGTLLARHPVIAQPARDCVRAAIPENAIIARTAIDHIIANEANQQIIAAKPKDRIRGVDLIGTSDLILGRVAGQCQTNAGKFADQ